MLPKNVPTEFKQAPYETSFLTVSSVDNLVAFFKGKWETAKVKKKNQVFLRKKRKNHFWGWEISLILKFALSVTNLTTIYYLNFWWNGGITTPNVSPSYIRFTRIA